MVYIEVFCQSIYVMTLAIEYKLIVMSTTRTVRDTK